jgi:SanA protein
MNIFAEQSIIVILLQIMSTLGKTLTMNTFAQKIKWALRVAIAAALLIIIATASINAYIIYSASGHIADSLETTAPAPVAIVLGASVRSKSKLSGVYEERVEKALALYRIGRVKKLLITGTHREDNYDEVNPVKSYLLARSVPLQDIMLDHYGYNTFQSLYRAQAIFGIKRAIVVTQRFHLHRAVYLARRLGIAAEGLPADDKPSLSPEMRRWKAREILARVKAFIDITLVGDDASPPVNGNAEGIEIYSAATTSD